MCVGILAHVQPLGYRSPFTSIGNCMPIGCFRNAYIFFGIMYCICRVIQNATMSSPFVIFQCVALSQSFNIEIDYHKATLVLEKSTDLWYLAKHVQTHVGLYRKCRISPITSKLNQKVILSQKIMSSYWDIFI